MAVKITSTPLRVTVAISGEIDHHNAAAMRYEADDAIGFVLGRYRVVQSYGGNVEVVNLSRRLYSMMKLAGLEKLVTLKTKDRERKKDNETDK